MNSKTFLAVLIVLIVVLSGSCSEKEKNAEPVFEQIEVEKITVSPLSQEDFLVPLDKYSWEREYEPEYVMLHFTSGVVLSKENPYDYELVRGIFEQNEVSVHYIIDRDGSVLCYIPEDRAAWHAGKGTFGGDERFTNAMNKYSIGIEIMAIGSQKDMAQYLSAEEYNSLDSSFVGFTEQQYVTLKELVKDICQRNNIPFDREHVIGHDMYNPDKTDPGELFDYNRIFE